MRNELGYDEAIAKNVGQSTDVPTRQSPQKLHFPTENKNETTSQIMAPSTNITWHQGQVSQQDRWSLSNHKGAVIWFTGLSGSGKSTVASALEVALHHHDRKIRTYRLDGDNIRHGLCSNLGFSADDRAENIRRVGQVAKLMADAGIVVLCALISPYRADRASVRQSVEPSLPFVEVFVKASLETCEGRDPKGLYSKARQGLIQNFTGISDPYQEPTNPEITLDNSNGEHSVEELVQQVVSWLDEHETLKV